MTHPARTHRKWREEMRHPKVRPVISGDRHREVAAHEDRSLDSLDIPMCPSRATSLCPNRTTSLRPNRAAARVGMTHKAGGDVVEA